MGAFISIASDKFVSLFDWQNANNLIKNIDATLFCNNEFVCVQNSGSNGSYVCSLSNAYATYPLEELDKIDSKTQKFIAKVVLNILEKLFKFIEIDKAIFINNRLFSTNFFPLGYKFSTNEPQISLEGYTKTHFLVIRNINSQRDLSLIESLRNSGWLLLPARVVYIFEYALLYERKRKNHYKKDMSLLAKTNLTIKSTDFNYEDFVVMQELFEALYIKKHSKNNPQYSANFFQKCFLSGELDFFAFLQDGCIVAFIAVNESNNILSTPALGYDTNLPQEIALYRMLCAKLHEIAEIRKMDINFSSGAGDFKKARGAKAVLEFTAIYTKNLIFYKKVFIKIFAFTLNKYEQHFIKVLDK